MIVALSCHVCIQCSNDKLIPVSTTSDRALTLYREAMAAYDDAYYEVFVDLLSQALKEDPEFFMANYNMAIYCLYYDDEGRFREYGKRAENCKCVLSQGEIIMKDAITQLMKKSDSDATPFGQKLIKAYPQDPNAYNQLFYYYRFIKNPVGQEQALQKALAVAENQAPIYNWLGYTYMTLNRYDDALAAFDKYIELKPTLPNPYDSKGDFFMRTKEYRSAYDNFMKANAIDSTWSITKALNAKTIADSLDQ